MRAIGGRRAAVAAAASVVLAVGSSRAEEAARGGAAPPPDAAASAAADETEVGLGAIPPLGGLGMRLGAVGAWTDVSGVDDALVAAGHAPLSSSRFGPVVGFQLQVTRVEVGVEVMAVGDWSTDAAIVRPSFHHSAVLGTAEVAAVRLGPLSFGPSIGFGVARSSLCVAGPARPRRSPEDTAFRQVLLDAGRESCLSSDTSVLRPGLAAEVTFWTDPEDDEPRLGFGAGLRGGAVIPLGGDSRWTLDLVETRVEDLEGPAAPAGGWYLGLDVGVAFGIGRDD